MQFWFFPSDGDIGNIAGALSSEVERGAGSREENAQADRNSDFPIFQRKAQPKHMAKA
jgi:hypothetical protein